MLGSVKDANADLLSVESGLQAPGREARSLAPRAAGVKQSSQTVLDSTQMLMSLSVA